jgi:hypothetical protein
MPEKDGSKASYCATNSNPFAGTYGADSEWDLVYFLGVDLKLSRDFYKEPRDPVTQMLGIRFDEKGNVASWLITGAKGDAQRRRLFLSRRARELEYRCQLQPMASRGRTENAD